MNQTALITGASGGIGWEIAKLLGERGYNLIVVARSKDKLMEFKKLFAKHSITIDVIPMDLTEPDAAKKLFIKTTELERSVDVLVNNAGFGASGDFDKIAYERQMEMIQLNITTLTALCHFYLPSMKQKQSGHIINIASTAAFQAGPFMGVYFATKAYVLSFTEALAEELKGSGVYATAICPGPTTSGFQAAADMVHAKLFNKKLPSSLEVAQFTIDAMERKKVVAVHGTLNNALVLTGKLSPRALTRKITKTLIQAK